MTFHKTASQGSEAIQQHEYLHFTLQNIPSSLAIAFAEPVSHIAAKDLESSINASRL